VCLQCRQALGAKFWMSVLLDIKNCGVGDVFFLVCDGLKDLPAVVANVWPQATVQTSSVDTAGWRDGLAGHRTTGRGPMQTCAFEAQLQTCPSRWRRPA
jgi:hypothetical protein